MAKRKRLTPARTDVFSANPPLDEPPAPARAPIAQVAGDAAVTAAFEEVQSELVNAQRDGRMIVALPLGAVTETFLIRDRLNCDPEDLAALKESLRLRGQQTPIEVTDLGAGEGYGLISGWRRLRALRELHAESGGLARYGTVQALMRLPEDRPAAYVAMVEENEIRADLSFYERARIVVQAVMAGVYDSDKHALQSLFSTASFAKRSKIKSFMPLVRGLDGTLRYPAQIPERLGLKLSKALEREPDFSARLVARLRPGEEMRPEEERKLLETALKPEGQAACAAQKTPTTWPVPVDLTPGLSIRIQPDRVELSGPDLTEALIEDLKNWLSARG